MYLGIDLGTSAVKALLVDDRQQPIDQASCSLTVERPRPSWCEQSPEKWWQATASALASLRSRHPAELEAVRAIGLTGQMHGAVLLDNRGEVLRPAILWNDGRSAPQCAALERAQPRSRAITGNLAMPGFTAPKLLWVAEHEPDVFRRLHKVLLPKDYLRWRMTGESISEMSDAAGTLWLDVGERAWSEAMLQATGLSVEHMPRLVEGTQPAGELRAEVARAWGLRPGTVIAGGGGDNAAGAAGAGVIRSGQALLSLGTSGVYFVAADRFSPNPQRAVHTFCHCLPHTWHQMSVVLSAASCLSWITQATGAASEAALLAEIEADGGDEGVLFLPYLCGERTPHNDPHARGVFFGLTHATGRAALGRAVLEGVAFALADGQQALQEAGTSIDSVAVIGGGARSALWGRILASALDRPLTYSRGGDLGPAFGAARLARLALTGEDAERVCTPLATDRIVEPDPALRDRFRQRLELFRALYRDLRRHWEDTDE